MGEMHPICQRLRELRERAYGPRGRSAFARDLGLAPSTYAHFEQGRLPGAEVLHRAARLTRVSMEWLLTGDDSALVAPSGASDISRRIADLLARHPDLEPSISRMLDSLEQAAKTVAPAVSRRAHVARTSDREGWIPVIGSTAAGTARFWTELPGAHPGEETESRLATLIDEASRADIRTSPGQIDTPSFGATESSPMLVQCSHPDRHGLLEFVAAPALKQRYPRSVAWRIDGDSMEPRYRDADLVIVSTDLPALEGQPCVARQRGQIGVNCKLLRHDGDDVLLIPINERYPVQRFPATQLEWALRVVGMLRLHT